MSFVPQSGQSCLRSLRLGRDIYLCWAVPGPARAAAWGFRLVKVGRKHASPRLSPENRAGQLHAIPGEAALPPVQRVRILTDTPSLPPRYRGGALPAPPGAPRLRRSRRDTEEFRGRRSVPGWALRDGRVSFLRGQAGQGQRLPQSRRSLGSCRRPDFTRGRPWAGGLSLPVASALRLRPALIRPRPGAGTTLGGPGLALPGRSASASVPCYCLIT